MPPRLAASLLEDAQKKQLEARDVDFTIVMTPERPAPTHDVPHPPEPPDSVCVDAVRHFNIMTHRLYSFLKEVPHCIP